ncbi:hypothetical protein LX32DRAFT_152925 [Colletotrichum zoysiae]|uniref:Secreted protein n=1 Tax=Colletotrichum zoysiae TaxID=1216348 RepID=A0AAD9M5H1_9PEZI|nr:hypothetical protein LX32DRAFT_152925 [Colletotrichum zoysiae]
MSFLSLCYLLLSMSPSKAALPLVTCGRQVCQILFHICLIPAAGLQFRLNLALGKSTLCFWISRYRALEGDAADDREERVMWAMDKGSITDEKESG